MNEQLSRNSALPTEAEVLAVLEELDGFDSYAMAEVIVKLRKSAPSESVHTREAVIEECAKAIEKRNADLCSDPEVCWTEPDTGATVIARMFMDHVEALDEAAEIVRALKEKSDAPR